MNTISKMPKNARVWVYQSTTLLTEEQINTIIQKGSTFVEDWTAHGSDLKASFDVLYHRFIVLSVDEDQAYASGCSIDKSISFMKQLENELQIQLLDRMQVAFRNDNKIEVCSLAEFGKMAGRGEVQPTTIVFNNMIATKAEFDTAWEIPLQESWQKRVLN